MVIKINYLRKQDDELRKKSEKESKEIGKTWDWTYKIKELFNKALGKDKEKKKKINKNDLIGVIQYDRLLYDGQILPSKSQVAASDSFKRKTINDSYRKETDKNKESFGSVESITIKAFLCNKRIEQCL